MTAIDILLAVYNGEEFLPDFLDSLVRQSFRDFRLIVSDNMSSDRTLSILEEYRARLARPMFLLPPQNAFVSAHANFARVTEAAENEYIMFADADDVWHGDKIEKTLSAMKEAEARYGADTPILVHSDLTVVNHKLRRMHPSFWRYQFIDPRRTGLNQLLLQNCVTGCTAMLNRRLLALGRPIPSDACAHDHWYALVASAFGRVVAIPDSLIEYRQHGGNVTGAKRWGVGYVADRARQLYGRDGARQTIARNIRQAEILLSRFNSQLNQDQRQLVENFAGIRDRGVVSRRYALIRNAFWKRGVVRNLGLLLAI
ncbi:MAG TPA: glycosyltransferase family 2 protein [Bryobacteraceae bacterium]